VYDSRIISEEQNKAMKTIMSALPLSAAGAAIAVASWAMPSHALTTIGNTLYDNGTNPFNQPTGISTTSQSKGVSFTTDSRAWSLNSVRLTLTGFDDGDSPLIQIRADNAGDPSTALVDLGNPNPPPDIEGEVKDFTFTPLSAFSFAPNTTYWLVLSATTSNIYNWVQLQNNRTPTSTQGWSFNRYEFSTNGGTTWNTSSIQNAFQIDATEIAPVPFAFTPIPGLIVSGIIGAARRARKSRNAEGVAEA
jgi:hypothetical protein